MCCFDCKVNSFLPIKSNKKSIFYNKNVTQAIHRAILSFFYNSIAFFYHYITIQNM